VSSRRLRNAADGRSALRPSHEPRTLQTFFLVLWPARPAQEAAARAIKLRPGSARPGESGRKSGERECGVRKGGGPLILGPRSAAICSVLQCHMQEVHSVALLDVARGQLLSRDRPLPTKHLGPVVQRPISVLKYLEKVVRPRCPTPPELTKGVVGIFVVLLSARLSLMPNSAQQHSSCRSDCVDFARIP
jgi:hypothetical protein